MNALNRDLFRAICRAVVNSSNSLLCFFAGVAASLLYDAVLVNCASPPYIVVINLIIAGVIATSISLRSFVNVFRQRASRLGNEAQDILARHATKAFLAAISKPLAFIIKTIRRLRKALADEGPIGPLIQPELLEEFSNYGKFMAGFVAGRLVHLAIQFVYFVIQTRIFMFLFCCFQSLLNFIMTSLYIFPLIYFIFVALLSSVAVTAFVIIY